MKDFAATPAADPAFPASCPVRLAAVVIQLKADQSLSPTRRRDLIASLRRVAKALGQRLEDIPADPKELQPQIEKVSHVALGLKKKSWANTVSNARAALVHCGIASRRINRRDMLSPAWQSLWQRACETDGIHDSTSRLVFFLDGLGIGPDDVLEHHATVYRDNLVGEEIRKNPTASFRNAVNSWNRAVDRVPGWPSVRFSGPPPTRTLIKIPINRYDPSFAADLERFCKVSAHDDPFSGSSDRALRPASIETYARLLERFAGALVASGVSPDEIRTLADLVNPPMAERGLRWFYVRYGNKCTRGLELIAITLQQAGRRHVRLDEAEQRRLDQLVRSIMSWKGNDPTSTTTTTKKKKGLTKKNRDRLRVMLEPAMRKYILTLPETLMAGARDGKSQKACLQRELAIAVGILIYCPVRRGNLVSIDLNRHIQRPGNERAYLTFLDKEVKNNEDVEFELPSSLLKLIDRHLATRSPRLCPPGTPWLFPKRDGSRPMQADHLAGLVRKGLKRELGIAVNLHLFRHFAVHILLEAMPGNYEAARRLLGHSALSSTINAYTGIETIRVAQIFGNIIDQEKKR